MLTLHTPGGGGGGVKKMLYHSFREIKGGPYNRVGGVLAVLNGKWPIEYSNFHKVQSSHEFWPTYTRCYYHTFPVIAFQILSVLSSEPLTILFSVNWRQVTYDDHKGVCAWI